MLYVIAAWVVLGPVNVRRDPVVPSATQPYADHPEFVSVGAVDEVGADDVGVAAEEAELADPRRYTLMRLPPPQTSLATKSK